MVLNKRVIIKMEFYLQLLSFIANHGHIFTSKIRQNGQTH